MHLRTTASRATTLLARNPGLFCRVLGGKIASVRRMPPLPVSQRIENVWFEYDNENYRGTAAMYFGSYSPLVRHAMDRLLNPGGIFFDVGANIGYLSAIAAGLVGPKGQVYAFEPVPAYFARLKRLAELNPRYTIVPDCCAAGDADGMSEIHITREAGQNTLVPSYKSASEIIGKEKVRVTRLDSFIEAHAIAKIELIKIDAEGYEFPILKGLEGFLRRTRRRPPIICEIAPRAYGLLGKSLLELKQYMDGFGYRTVDLADGKTSVNLCSIDHVDDVLFLAKAAA